jgi:hypothetical protein
LEHVLEAGRVDLVELVGHPGVRLLAIAADRLLAATANDTRRCAIGVEESGGAIRGGARDPDRRDPDRG